MTANDRDHRDLTRRMRPFSRVSDLVVLALIATFLFGWAFVADRTMWDESDMQVLRRSGGYVSRNIGWILTAYLTTQLALFAIAVGGDRIMPPSRVDTVRNSVAFAGVTISATLVPLVVLFAAYSIAVRKSATVVMIALPFVVIAYVIGIQAGRQFHLSPERIFEMDEKRLTEIDRLRDTVTSRLQAMGLSPSDAGLGYVLVVLFWGSVGAVISCATESPPDLHIVVIALAVPLLSALFQCLTVPSLAEELWRRHSRLEHTMNHFTCFLVWVAYAMATVVGFALHAEVVGHVWPWMWLGQAATLVLPPLSAFAIRRDIQSRPGQALRLFLVDLSLEPRILARARKRLEEEHDRLTKNQDVLTAPGDPPSSA